MKLVFSRAAVRDLIRLREFIAWKNPEAAIRGATKLRASIQNLIESPQIGRPVADLPGEVRELIVGNYVVRYDLREQSIYILRIWHGKEDR